MNRCGQDIGGSIPVFLPSIQISGSASLGVLQRQLPLAYYLLPLAAPRKLNQSCKASRYLTYTPGTSVGHTLKALSSKGHICRSIYMIEVYGEGYKQSSPHPPPPHSPHTLPETYQGRKGTDIVLFGPNLYVGDCLDLVSICELEKIPQDRNNLYAFWNY